MQQAKSGDTVKVDYTGKLEDGTIFDTSASREPLQFMIGSGQIIPGFDKAVIGMNVGDKKTINIPGVFSAPFSFWYINQKHCSGFLPLSYILSKTLPNNILRR